VRVNAGSEAEPRPHGRDTAPSLGFLNVPAGQDAEAARHSGLARTSEDLGEIVRVYRVGQMAVAVDHLTRLPGGGGLSKPRRTGKPPSGLAASTMPFDSIPISFAGFRFATITIDRPTSASGS
jgi:hypothetical protein